MNNQDCLNEAMFLASESYSSSSYMMKECTQDLGDKIAAAFLSTANVEQSLAA